MKSLEKYKIQYDALVERINHERAEIKEFMEGNVTKVAMYFRKTDEILERTRTDLFETRDAQNTIKFDIDKLTSYQN